jgi:hypothetical protein
MVPDGGTAMGGGALGGLLPYVLGGGGGGSGCGGNSGISPLLLLLLLGQGQSGCCNDPCCSSHPDPSTFAEVLAANVGRRVRLILGTGNGLNSTGYVVIATIASIHTDFVVLENICINGRPEPVLSRLDLLTSQILGIHPLTRTDELMQLSCVLGSCFF